MMGNYPQLLPSPPPKSRQTGRRSFSIASLAGERGRRKGAREEAFV